LDTLVISIANKNKLLVVVYFETIKRELNKRLIYESRCDERLKVKPGRSSRLTYTVTRGTGTPKDLRWYSRGGSRSGPRDPGLKKPWIPGKDLGPD
jgi:hypothetical protein